MATCRDIVTRSLRMVGIIGQGETPEAEELENGMVVLQSMYDQWFIAGLFGRLKDTREEGDNEAIAGQRIYAPDGVVTLPVFADAECPWRDLSAIEVFDVSGRRAYVWDRDEWTRIDDLEPGDDAPLSGRGANGLAACLASYYAEEYGAQIGAGAARQAVAFKNALSLKMGSTQDVAPGVYF